MHFLLDRTKRLVQYAHRVSGTRAGFEIAVETNGTQVASAGIDWICVSPKARTEIRLRSGHELKLVFPQDGASPELYEQFDFQHFFLQPVTRGFDSESKRIAAQQWWHTLARWSGPKSTELRSITAIARRYPRVPLLVVESFDYLHAMDQDLLGAAALLANSNLLLIASAGMRTFGQLTDHLLPCDARLQSCLGGTRGSLNIRIAKRLLQYMGRGPISLEQQKSQLRRLLNKQPPIEHYRRRAMTDEHIRKFICLELKRNSGASRSLLLRKLRDSGRACEQSRFAGLYGNMVTDEKIA